MTRCTCYSLCLLVKQIMSSGQRVWPSMRCHWNQGNTFSSTMCLSIKRRKGWVGRRLNSQPYCTQPVRRQRTRGVLELIPRLRTLDVLSGFPGLRYSTSRDWPVRYRPLYFYPYIVICIVQHLCVPCYPANPMYVVPGFAACWPYTLLFSNALCTEKYPPTLVISARRGQPLSSHFCGLKILCSGQKHTAVLDH